MSGEWMLLQNQAVHAHRDARAGRSGYARVLECEVDAVLEFHGGDRSTAATPIEAVDIDLVDLVDRLLDDRA